MSDPLVLVEETPDGEAVVRHNTKMSENDVLMDLGRQIIGLRREIERYETREEYFGDILSLADHGRYRADWETAIKRVVAKRDALQKSYDELCADYDRRSRLAEELSVERDEALKREKALREALRRIADPGEPGKFSVVDENREFITDFASFGDRARAALSRPGEQGEAIIAEDTRPQIKIDCPRAKSDMTPCAARDGKTACADGGTCVGCGEHPADLLMDLVPRYVKKKEALERLSAPPVTVRDVPQSEVDAAEKPGSPRQFQVGDRVRVKETCGLTSRRGWVGTVTNRTPSHQYPLFVAFEEGARVTLLSDDELELVQNREKPAEETPRMPDTSHPKVLRGRRIVCAATGGVHFERAEVGTFQFVDYSWECAACGGRHCSECDYESDGVTITVTDCGRFGVPTEEDRDDA